LIISVFQLDEYPESASTLRLLGGTDGSLTSNCPAIRNGKPYLWAIYSGICGSDLLLSGLADTKREVERIADQYGLKADFRLGCENNKDFVGFFRNPNSKAPVVSYIKRQSGKYTLAAWHNLIDCMIGAEPFAFEDHDSEDALQTAAVAYGGAKSPFIGYWADGTLSMCFGSHEITNHIRRKEAQRKFATPSSSTTTGNVEFVYVNYNEGSYRSDWKRHRIIKTTDQHIFVDRYPFCGKGYLRSGWRAMVVYATILDRESMENEQCFYHKTYRRTFYTEKQAKKRCRKFFIKGGAFTERVVELPRDDLSWALKLLGVAPWPAMSEAIKKAYARAVMKHHPDRAGGTHQGFIDCTDARDFLMDMIVV